MFTHAPQTYQCPICLAVNGVENKNTLIVKNDIIYQDKLIMVFIGSFYIEGNEGHPIIVPVGHYENIFDIPNKEMIQISEMLKVISFGIKKPEIVKGLL